MEWLERVETKQEEKPHTSLNTQKTAAKGKKTYLRQILQNDIKILMSRLRFTVSTASSSESDA